MAIKIIIATLLVLIFKLIGNRNLIADSLDVYIINYSYHTGIVLPVDSTFKSNFIAAKDFLNYRTIDIGWGDADFYQIPGFDLYLAAKALFVPTPSVLRLEGIDYPIRAMPENYDFIFLLRMSVSQLLKLIEVINLEFRRTDTGGLLITSEQYSGKVRFYESNRNYHAFNTCNTWIARVLRDGGFNISTFMVITEQDLYNRLKRIAKLIKPLN